MPFDWKITRDRAGSSRDVVNIETTLTGTVSGNSMTITTVNRRNAFIAGTSTAAGTLTLTVTETLTRR